VYRHNIYIRRLFIVESVGSLGKREEPKAEEFKLNGIVNIFKNSSQTTLDKNVSALNLKRCYRTS
jgi:hypothetical protein